MKIKDLAYALGISESMAHRLKKRGMPVHTIEDAERWRAKHLDATRTKQHRLDGNTGRKGAGRAAAGRTADAGGSDAPAGGTVSDLVAERTRLAKEQADKVAMENAVRRGELSPTILIEQVLSATAAKIAGTFDAIPGMVRRRCPDLSQEAIGIIQGEIAKARNMVASMSLDDLAINEDADPLETGGVSVASSSMNNE
jgi:phage terminase Nu1 subunit (DNA packaging protein)